MKKTITQLTMLFAFLVMGTMTYAQCNGSVYIKNTSNDDWTISYYNNDIVVPAQSDATLGFVNANIMTGRGVLLTSNPNSCNHKFQTNPDIWFVPCTMNTNTVYYEVVSSSSPGCYNNANIYIY